MQRVPTIPRTSEMFTRHPHRLKRLLCPDKDSTVAPVARVKAAAGNNALGAISFAGRRYLRHQKRRRSRTLFVPKRNPVLNHPTTVTDTFAAYGFKFKPFCLNYEGTQALPAFLHLQKVPGFVSDGKLKPISIKKFGVVWIGI